MPSFLFFSFSNSLGSENVKTENIKSVLRQQMLGWTIVDKGICIEAANAGLDYCRHRNVY